ncbi:thiamine biosynthesis regulatory protein [Monosporozyma unispora]
MSVKQDKRERTFTGCWSCRLKKRRCDVGKPSCSLCAKHNLPCSYDVRLVWSEENIYKTSDEDIVDVLHCDKKRNKVTKQRKHGLSKSEFKDIIHSKQSMGPRNSNYDNGNKKNDQTFTISVRRFQVYNNEIKSVFGARSTRIYDQKVIDKKLTLLLNQLDQTVEDSSKLNCIQCQQGPFNVFHTLSQDSSIKKAVKSETDPFDESLSNIESPIFSPGSDMSHDTVVDPQMDYLSHINKIDLELNHFEDSYFDFSHPVMDPNLSYSYLQTPTTQLASLIETEEGKTFNLLLTHCTNNMILSRQEYATWFSNHMKQLGQDEEESQKFINEILTDTQLIGAEKYIDKLLNMGSLDKELQIVGLTIIVVLHGFYNELGFFHQLEQWFLTQDNLKYSMYPLINFIINHSESCEIFNHCHYLITTFLESEDPYQDGLTFELDTMITDKLVGKWKDKISLQLTLNEDITESTSQLKYWQLQSKCNEQFYRDVNKITELSTTIQTI